MGSLKSCLDKVMADGLLTKSQRDDVSSYFRTKAREMSEEGHEGGPTDRHIEAVSEMLEKVLTERESILKQAKVTIRLKTPPEDNVEPSPKPTGTSGAVASKSAVQKGQKVSSGTGSKQARGSGSASQTEAKVEPKPKETAFERMARLNREQWMGVGSTGRKQPKAKPVEKEEKPAATKSTEAKPAPKDKGPSEQRAKDAETLRQHRADLRSQKSDEKQIAKVKAKIEEGKAVNDISASDLKKWADDVVKEGNLNAGLNPRLLAAHAVRAADWIAQNGAKFAEWSKSALKEFGQSIGRHLHRIWAKAKDAVANGATKWLEKTGAIKYMSDNTGRPPAPERPAGRPAFSKWQDMGLGDAKLQAEALDNAWKAFRGQGKAKKLTDAQIEEGWAEEIANPDSPFISRAVRQIKSKDSPKEKQASKTVEGDKVEPHPIPAGDGFNFSIPTLTKTAKGYALAGKPLEGEAGNIPVSGLKGISQLKDDEIELYKTLVPEAFSGDKVNVPKLMDGLAKAGPQVEVHTYGQGGKIDPDKEALDKMTHEWVETLPTSVRSQLEGGLYESGMRGMGADRYWPASQQVELYSELSQRGGSEVNKMFWGDAKNRQKAEKYFDLRIKAGSAPKADDGPKATHYYNSISPFDTKKHPVIRVDVVLPINPVKYPTFEEWAKKNNEADTPDNRERHRKIVSAKIYGVNERPLWSQDDLHENLPNTLGWAMVQVVPDPKTGEDVLFVGELQSRWAQERGKRLRALQALPDLNGKLPEGWNVMKTQFDDYLLQPPVERDGELDSIMGGKVFSADTKEKLAEDFAKWKAERIQNLSIPNHPLLEVHQPLVLKAVIAEARKRGIKKVVISDSKSALMTEMLDAEHTFKGPFKTKEMADAEAEKLGGSWKAFDHSYIENGTKEVKPAWYVSDKQGGFDVAYDTTLPSIMSKLTGEKGEMVDFGTHKNAVSKRLVGDPAEVGGMEMGNGEGSPVFKNPDGTKKKNVTARVYGLDGLDRHRATQLFADPFGFQLVKSSLVIAAREAGNLARFTSRIVKQFGQWIADHAKSLWTAAAKGAKHVGEYLKGVVDAAKKTSETGAVQFGGTVNVPQVSTKNSSPATKAKTNALLAGITDMLKRPGERTPSGLLSDRSKMGAARKFYHDVAGNVVSESRRIHKVLGAAMEHLDFRTAQEAKDYETLMNPSWTQVFSKLKDKDKDLRIAYLRGDIPAQHDIVRSVAGEEGVKLYEQAIKNYEVFYKKAVKAGLKLNKVNRYLPTRLKAGAYPELLGILRKHGMMDDISRVLKKTNKDIAGMDEFEGAEVIQGALASIFGPSGNRHFKSRTGIALDERVMDEIAPLYETFDNVIGHYGVQLTDAIVRAEALGPDSIKDIKEYMDGKRNPEEGLPDGSPLGLIFEKLRRDGEVNEHDLLRFKELVNARFGYLPDGFVEKWLKSGNMSLALANPFSAIRQVGSEIVKSLYRNGTLPTILGIKDALRGKGVSVTRDLFLSPDFEIGQGNDPMKWVNSKLAKLSGFRAADLFPANVIANASLHRLGALSREGLIKEISHLKDFFSKDTTVEAVADKIKRGEFDDPDVWRVAWHELTALRPTGLGTRPIAVLRNRGLTRVAYNLKEWGVTSLNFMKETTYDNLRSGDPEKVKLGLQALSLLTTGMVLAGASGDALVDWLLGKDVQFDEKVKDNIAKIGMASRYQLGQVLGTKGQRPSVKDALLNYMSTPTLSLIDSLGAATVKSIQDDEKSFMDIVLKDKQLARAVPLGIGTAYFAWSGESGERDRERQVESRLPERVLQLTEEASKLRDMGEDKRNKRTDTARRWRQLSSFSKIKSWRTKLAEEAAKSRDFAEAEAQLRELDRISRSPHLWAGEAERIGRLKAARERLEKAAR